MKKIAYIAALGALLMGSAACSTVPNVNASTGQVVPIQGPPPAPNTSPMELAFACFGQATRQRQTPLRLAVGNVRDYSGKFSNEASEGGFRVSQGGSLMVMSALGKLPGISQVERFDTDIANAENVLARNEQLQDPVADLLNGNPTSLRAVRRGMVQGSDYYIVGGITEVNYDIVSGGAELGISLFEAGMRYYVINTAVDLRLVDTRTLKVVKTVSVQKQIIGYETRAGLFRFFGDYLVDINTGRKGQEPLQLGVRATLEYATLELLSPIYQNYFSDCAPLVDASFRS